MDRLRTDGPRSLHICSLTIGQHVRSPAVLTLQQYFISNERVLNNYLMLNFECHRIRAGPVSEEPAEASQSDRDDLLAAHHLPTNEFVKTDWLY